MYNERLRSLTCRNLDGDERPDTGIAPAAHAGGLA
jgi:hypothetical protein